jgi:hypothetical protein
LTGISERGSSRRPRSIKDCRVRGRTRRAVPQSCDCFTARICFISVIGQKEM